MCESLYINHFNPRVNDCVKPYTTQDIIQDPWTFGFDIEGQGDRKNVTRVDALERVLI